MPLGAVHPIYAGVDVPLGLSGVCVVDATGRIVREAKVASEPEALVAWFGGLGIEVARIGLEAGPLPGRCRSGSSPRCAMPASRWSCWRPGT